jgi:type VI secretion system protein VasJ
MEIKELGRTPIPGTAPAGQDPRYEPEFEQLQAEIEKLSSVSAGGVADWPRIVDLASQVLSTKAKDLTAAAYLAVGLTQTRGLEGLALGTHLLDDLCAVFWEDCFPAKKRMRGRQAAFTWWQERSLAWLRALPGDTAVTPELSRDLIAGAEALDKRLGELMPDFPPLRNFLEALERLAPAEPQAQAAPQDAPAPQTTSAAAPQAQPAQAQPQDVGAARELLRSAALNFAALAVAETPTDPWIWRANRLASWIKIKALPPAEGGRTMIPAPEPSVKQTLQVLLSEGKFSEAARAAEEQVTASLFWLDPHRVAAKALEGLGPEYAPALAAVQAEVRLFLARLPGVEQLAFADGAPFADAETQAWLATLSSGQDAGRGKAAAAQDDATSQAVQDAEQRFARKDELGALDVLGQAARQAQDGPSRLRLTMAQMSLLGRAGRWPVAASLAEAVVAEVDRRGLEDWDPDLAVDALLAARGAFAGMGGEDGQSRARTLAARVARIRPAAALHLAG